MDSIAVYDAHQKVMRILIKLMPDQRRAVLDAVATLLDYEREYVRPLQPND